MFRILVAAVSCILMNSPGVLSFQLYGALVTKWSFCINMINITKFRINLFTFKLSCLSKTEWKINLPWMKKQSLISYYIFLDWCRYGSPYLCSSNNYCLAEGFWNNLQEPKSLESKPTRRRQDEPTSRRTRYV